MGWLSDLLRGGGEEVGWDDLIRRIVEAILPLRVYGRKGDVTFPADVVVRITVAEANAAVLRDFVDRPDLDHDVGATLANRADVAMEALPVREYVLSTADRLTVVASEGVPRVWSFAIDGGDLKGQTLTPPSGWTQLAFGRGTWHGADHGAKNDLVVCNRTEYVSRRAGRLFRAGHQLEVASLDQGDELVVRRASGEGVRPSRTARGSAVVKSGDIIELGDGHGKAVKLVVKRS